ncbi:MAG: SsrA-binding protein SmpB [Parvibaculales bacterium]
MSSKSGGRKKTAGDGLIADNRRGRYDYEIIDTVEAGLVLAGTEVKSLRAGKANITHAYISFEQGEAFLINADIPEYKMGNRNNHKPTQSRKLLLKKRELNRLAAAVQRDGITIIPLKLYFTDKGLVKMLVGQAKGRKKTDKRENEKRRDWQRDKARLIRERG